MDLNPAALYVIGAIVILTMTVAAGLMGILYRKESVEISFWSGLASFVLFGMCLLLFIKAVEESKAERAQKVQRPVIDKP